MCSNIINVSCTGVSTSLEAFALQEMQLMGNGENGKIGLCVLSTVEKDFESEFATVTTHRPKMVEIIALEIQER